MDIKKLNAFLIAVQTGSINSAAEQLGYTQAGLAYVINSLENELGLPLIDRNFSGIKLNENGKVLLPEIEQIVADYEKFTELVNRRKNDFTETLKIASIETITIAWLPQAIKIFSKKYPNINIHVLTATPFEINKLLEEGRVDFALSDNVYSSKKFHFISLFHDPFVGIFPENYDIKSPVSITDFNGTNFIPTEYKANLDVIKFFLKYNVKANFIDVSLSNQSVISNVAAGMGVSILPRLTLFGLSAKIKQIPLEQNLYRDLGVFIASKDAMTPVIQNFIKILKQIILEAEG